MGTDRKRAIALKAADARELIGKSLPMVLKYMTQARGGGGAASAGCGGHKPCSAAGI